MPEPCPHEDSYGRWKYEGSKFLGASGYCRDCDRGLEYCVQQNKLVLPEEVKERLNVSMPKL